MVNGGARVADRGEATNSLTIEELAAQSGMTVRNIRAHRARGLLPPPEVRERVGYYGPQHVARLQLIRELQADGLNLRAIERLLGEARGTPEQILSFRHAVSVPFETEQPKVFTAAELGALFGENDDLLPQVLRIGVLSEIGDDRYEAPMPSLLDAAAEVVERGVPLEHALAVTARVTRQCQAIAREFVKLFLEDLWKPFAGEGYPRERWAEVTESIDRLRPLSSQVLLATYQLTMTREVEAAFGREIERLAKRGR